MTSLLEQLPKIVADGKREAERIMERLDSNYRVGLQTHELVNPSRDTNAADTFTHFDNTARRALGFVRSSRNLATMLRSSCRYSKNASPRLMVSARSDMFSFFIGAPV
jgi:hypothetical protein